MHGVLAALDPNWFYSTLAQSTAAIVGLAGGFLAQRLVAQRGDLGGERLDLQRNVDSRYAEMLGQLPHLHAVVESMKINLSIVEQAREDGRQEVTLQRDFITTFSHGPGYAYPGEERWRIETAESYLRDTRDAAQALLDAYPSSREAFIERVATHASLDSTGREWLRDPPGDLPADGIDQENVYRWMPFQRALAQERFRTLDAQIEVLGGDLARMRAKLLPKSFFSLLGILTGLLLVGLIAPLFFLSARDDASRTLLLAGFVPLALAFVAFIAFELHRLREAGDLTKDF